MASTTSKDPEDPEAPRFTFGSRTTSSLPKSILSASDERPPSLSPERHSDWTSEDDHLLMQIGNLPWPVSMIGHQRYKVLGPREASRIEENRQRGLRMHEMPKTGEAEEESQLTRDLEEYRRKKVTWPELIEQAEANRRLQVTREADGWDTRKFQRLARDYMVLREQMWRGLAAHVGERWDIVEAKCMSSGLEHLRTAALAAARHDDLQSQTTINSGKRSIGSALSTPSSHFDGDSGIFSMTSAMSHRAGSSSTRWETPRLVSLRSPAPSQCDDEDSYASSKPDDVPSTWFSANTESNTEALEAERTLNEPDDASDQVAPTGSRNVTTRTTWEGMGYVQVEIGPHTVSRREDDNMINATKLFNVADVPRGRRDGILKSEKIRQVITEGPTHLKGVWIPYERALVFASTYQLTRVVHPLFAHNINAYLREPRVPRIPFPSAAQEAAPVVLGGLKLSKPGFPPEPERSGDSGYCELPVRTDPPSRLKSEPETTDSKADTLSATSESGLSSSSSSEEEEPSALSKDGQKRLLLNRLMKYFYEIFSSCPTQRGSMRTHTSGGRQGTSDSGSFRSGFSSSGPSNQSLGGGRKRSADDEPGEGDGQGGRAPKKPRGSEPLNESKEAPAKRLACPYFKMDPSRHHTARSCLGPGWANVHRIKEHLYRCHSRPISCPRCHETFENDRAKDEHMAAEVRCEIITRDGTVHEGFDSTQKELLRSRKKAHKQMTEIEKWYDVYMILFPGADPTNLPSPYYEYVSTDNADSPTSELSRYEQFLRRELPTRVRQQLEIRIEEELEPVEEHLRAQLVEIVRDVQLQLFDLYKASRTDKPQADAQDPSEPQEQPEPEQPEPHDGDADPSSFHAGGVVEPAQQSFHAPALPPVPSWNPTIDEELEAFRPEPPYTTDYFDDFNGLLFDFHPSLLTGSNSPGDSGYMSVPAFADYMQPKAQSEPQGGARPENPTFDGRRD